MPARVIRRYRSVATAIDAKNRAETYLRRVAALTGATQLAPYCYILDVGSRQFEVHDSYVCVVPRDADPQAIHRGTCYMVPNEHMPVAEKIATALLQLKKNPTLFEKWAGQGGVFKADGELFRPCADWLRNWGELLTHPIAGNLT